MDKSVRIVTRKDAKSAHKRPGSVLMLTVKNVHTVTAKDAKSAHTNPVMMVARSALDTFTPLLPVYSFRKIQGWRP
jgi:hypothetical protein